MVWASSTMGAKDTQAARIKTVISHPQYGPIATAVCRTAWGRKNFVVEHFDTLCTSKIMRVRRTC